MTSIAAPQPGLLRQYLVLTKPRVTQLAVFCAVIGMFLAVPGLPDLKRVLFGTIGIWLLAAAAFAINCLIEQEIDARMTRTARRGTARGTISPAQVLSLSGLLGGAGMLVLYHLVNPLTMWLTFATFVGYAVIYTVILKPRTPQNIVIGGLSGAMPPALGWASVANAVPAEAWVLVLIIFIWTPPHFWALALYRTEDYRKAGLPMLPITHGSKHTRLQIMLYSFALFAVTLLPYFMHMNGLLYLLAAVILGGIFVAHALRLYRSYSDERSRRLFRYSILYLALLFGALLVDHWVGVLSA
ncbi:heme o synthase [Bordetella avium]|uniref:Protoheme IX farnesyltransferase n=1 Tax=Bordetella avium (strain 197N) TaxID=360910 RepID=COXX_BORA1|nr:heme o synthase [Bordetella avium]Q2KTX0.1 RecName: Full=Protoheme IX farnesyltransferase; AltName: Full=Heme B farnesyltransferase; AltName: Full=Heme O synthase [Bordetella avium 197N]AZY50602.1 protoheme IX farnesyltransferase [Bordetella avium]AZY53999.1 protoheme IX farnesyltransferase [Bordetella avium]RIQ15229.1 protoheme IX farnesyltransferase [Bordetella avium]RIQ19966.1 protoheme IX farnesyltransferase [Bordetella avium]RIQ34546.1 protoheme IX farnesyltransferase [Bordetella aviu